MFLPTLYSKRSDLKVNEWQIEIEGSKYRTISGIMDGQLVTSAWTTAIPMNEGKANSTTVEQQAVIEASAKHKKKLAEKYTADLDKLDEVTFREPMRCLEYDDYKNKLFDKEGNATQLMWSSSKLDGIRCCAYNRQLLSRKGKVFSGIPHILEALQPVFEKYPNILIDGEAYINHSEESVDEDGFEKICSAVKKIKPNLDELELSRKFIVYCIYDTYNEDKPEEKYQERYEFIKQVTNELNSPFVKLVEAKQINSEKELDDDYDNLRKNFYEGQIIRLNTEYLFKRTKNLLKRKEFVTDEFSILGVETGQGSRQNIAARVLLGDKNGKPIYSKNGEVAKASITGSFEYCKNILDKKNEIIGQLATIKFFRYNSTGAPYLPTMLALRDYE